MNTLDIFIFATNSIMPLLIIILLGYWLKSKKFFSNDFLKIGNKTVFRIFLPLLLFKNIIDIKDLSEINWTIVLYVLGIIILLVMIGIIMCTGTKDVKQKGVILQCIFRSNFALIGVPLSELIAGSEGVRMAAVLSMFTIPIYNILAVVVLSIYRKERVKVSGKKIIMDIIKNPLIIGVTMGILFVILRPYISLTPLGELGSKFTFISTSISYMAKAATPMALLILGGQFDFHRIHGYRRQIMLGTIGRCVLGPVLGVGIATVLVKLKIVVFDGSAFAALIALFATPVAVSSAIMAEEMENDGQLAGQLVVWTSLLSVISIFFVILFTRGMGVL